MRIAVIGSGYVGLVTAACLADSGNHVTGVDMDEGKVRRLREGHVPFFEPGLGELLTSNLQAGRLAFTTDLAPAVSGAEVVFLAVGTPPRADGSADLSMIETAARQVAQHLTGPCIAVVKSTVPVGTGARLEEIIRSATRHHCPVVSNPEFLKEGDAVNDFLRPDRVVIGTDDAQAGDIIAELYGPFVRNNKPILRMSRSASELCKYAANAYLATRISFINEIAEICERFGVDVSEVRLGMGTDARIGLHFLYPGIGYGGSCFPKDVQALASSARSVNASCEILDSVHRRNQAQRDRFTQRILDRFGGTVRGKRFAAWGIAFKPKTDDVREAPALSVIEALLSAGASVAVHDPRAMETTRSVLGSRVEYCEDAYAATRGADALLIFTEWNEFRSPDFQRLKTDMKQPLIFDGRNLYDARTMRRCRFEYHSIGRPTVQP